MQRRKIFEEGQYDRGEHSQILKCFEMSKQTHLWFSAEEEKVHKLPLTCFSLTGPFQLHHMYLQQLQR